MATKKNYEYQMHIALPGMPRMRQMKEGEVIVVNTGKRSPSGAFCGAKNAAGIASKLGMQIKQRTMVLVDPVTYESMPVIAIECIKAAQVE